MISVHVLPNKSNWAVKRSDRSSYEATFLLKGEAVARATILAQQLRGELVVHNADGTIAYRNSYGNDPARFPG